MVAVRRVTIDARSVFNLTSPRWLPEVARLWTGSPAWHSADSEPVRDLLERTYVESFDRRTGHYAKLEQSMKANGVYNPVMLQTGPLSRRRPEELPPAVRADPRRVVCEYVGGSRLLIAARLGMFIPAIVNDHACLFSEWPMINPGSNVREFFKDKPRVYRWESDGSLYVNFFAYGHFGLEAEQRRREQIRIRKLVIADCIDAVAKWRKENVEPQS